MLLLVLMYLFVSSVSVAVVDFDGESGVGVLKVTEPSSQQCPPGMISYWKFDEGSGTTAYDSADANDGTIYGATWTTGNVDDALSFDGVDDYVSVSDDPSLRISEKLTIEAWVNITDRSYFREVVVKQGNYHFRIHDGYLRFNFWNGQWLGAEDDTTRLDTDTWYHIAFSFDTVNDIMKFYVNGNNVKNVTHGWDMLTWDDPVTIGSASPLDPSRDWFNGIIDEVSIHNRILTPEEIQQHYENGLTGLGYCGVDWWPMFHHDPSHTGYSTSTAPNTNNTIWNYTTGGRVNGSPAVVDGKIYVPSYYHVYCLDAFTGDFIWRYTTGDYANSDPAVVDGKVYVGSDDNKVYAFGPPRWPYDVTGDNYCGIDDIVYTAEHFGAQPGYPGPPEWNPIYDINCDDYVGIDDIVLIAEHFGEEDP